MLKDVPESEKAAQQQQLSEQWDQHQKQGIVMNTHTRRWSLFTPWTSVNTVGFLLVCGLQSGRSVQIQHSRQPWHRLHQELRSVIRLLLLHICPRSFPTYCSFDTMPSGNSASDTCAEFRVKYVGVIEKLQFDMSRTLQEPLDLINYIDAAQVRIWKR